ncbi:O-antigen ligase family protein [Liquorilactobacillus nagelii]|uniref:O-antigen ligase family protein n=1 Tax=Liquorilactobacillus nagelii TaxID=82688 RepID=UPI0039EB1415
MNLKIELVNVYSSLILFAWLLVSVLFLGNYNIIYYLIIWILLLLFFLLREKNELAFNKLYIFSLKRIMMIFIIYTCLSTMINASMGNFNSLSSYTRLLTNIVFFVVPYITLYYSIGKEFRIFFVKGYRSLLLFFSLLGVFEYVTKIQPYTFLIKSQAAIYNFLEYGSVQSSNYRTTLIFYHPNLYSTLLVVYFVFLIYKPFKNNIIQLIGVALFLANIILTQSRTGWISLFLVAILIFLKSFLLNLEIKKMVYKIAKVLIVFLLIFLFFSVFSKIYQSFSKILYERINDAVSGQAYGARLENWRLLSIAWKSFTNILIGGGDNYAISLLQEYPSINNWSRAIDNQFLTFLINYGVLGTSIFIYLTLKTLRCFFKSNDDIKSGICLAVFAILISSWTYEFFGLNSVNYLLFILICLI